MEKLSTGIDILDTRLDGGFPEGSVAAIIADPKSTAELFLYDLTTTRTTHYFTTTRSEKSITKNLEQMKTQPKNLRVIDISNEGDNLNRTVRENLSEVEEHDNIVFDTMSDIVNDYGDSDDLLDIVYQVSHEKNALTYLYMILGNDSSMGFNEYKIPYVSDIVMKMLSDISGEKVENRLAITKLRGEIPPPRTIKLNIGTSIEIDTSRDIA